MPPIIVNKKICFSGFDKLYDKLNSSFPMMNWDDLLDFTPLKDYVPVINRGLNFNLDSLKKSLGLNDKSDIYFIRGGRRYGIEFFDVNDNNKQLKEYQKKIFIDDIKNRNETLIHFGSLHGSKRIILKKPENRNFLRKIKEDLKFNHPILVDCVKKITNDLGGTRSFIGVHLRTGDGIFKSERYRNIRTIFDKISNYSINHNFTNNLLRKSLPNNVPKKILKCLESPVPLVTYIATDEKTPKKAFGSKLNPCTFILSDFNTHLEPLNHLKFKSFFRSLVDLLVVSNGGAFIGTRRSTFSKMAQEFYEFQ
ncbi:9371_t:CDS:1 [Cetraspora pellucida]|uniref:9371_t:CDS:1 n=1 Tax=Cetraspora pellucida TaxID=1433469 RepID=A0ACA9P832_9GLOM|nr:9371_t:CDS:1 [Cetraspora pellucida]